ncbi:MAG: phage terminase large subunit [Anaerolineae bacterium]|jgi:PBSX family phage terminase large subunit|nr:phage terminase large subunit [Anaerolineae bacterium]
MDKRPLQLHKKQLEFVLSNNRFTSFIGGIGSGKSHAGCAKAGLASGGIIGGQQVIPVPNLGVITAPTYANVRDVTLRTFQEMFAPAIRKFHKAEMRAEMINGSEILFRSVENYEVLRGINVSWWFGDEAALYHEDVWKIMIGRLRQFGRSGYAWLTTTPKGRNWLWREFVAKQRDAYRMIKARTTQNPYLDRDYVESLIEAYSGDFAAQELDGDFISFEGLIYPEFDYGTHVFQEMPERRRFKRVVAGVDWGFVNPGVVLVVGVDGDDNLWVLHEEYARKRRIEEWTAVAADLHQTYKISEFFCDPSDPDNIKHFKQAGLNAKQANNSVLAGIQRVRQQLVVRENGRPGLNFRNGSPNLIAEFSEYQWASNRDGLRDEPRKAQDHAMDALRYAVVGALGMTGVQRGGIGASTGSYIG